MVEFYNPDGVSPPVAAYTHAGLVKAGSDLLFIAGQVGITPDGDLPATIEGQADAAFANVVKVAESAGLGPGDIVKMVVYVTDRAYQDAAGKARLKHLQGAKPTSTFLIVQGLARPELMIEVDAIAAKP